MKIIGEVWIDEAEDVQQERTKNVIRETRHTVKRRHLQLECGHILNAQRTEAKNNTRCYECEPYRTFAEEADLAYKVALSQMKRRLEELSEDKVIGRMRNVLSELRNDIKSGYRPTLGELDELLAQLSAPPAPILTL